MTRHVLIEEGDSASECIEETVGEPPEQEPASGDPIVYLARGPPSVGVNQRECEHQESRKHHPGHSEDNRVPAHPYLSPHFRLAFTFNGYPIEYRLDVEGPLPPRRRPVMG